MADAESGKDQSERKQEIRRVARQGAGRFRREPIYVFAGTQVSWDVRSFALRVLALGCQPRGRSSGYWVGDFT